MCVPLLWRDRRKAGMSTAFSLSPKANPFAVEYQEDLFHSASHNNHPTATVYVIENANVFITGVFSEHYITL